VSHTHTHTHTQSHTCAHTVTHTHTLAHTDTHTHTLVHKQPPLEDSCVLFTCAPPHLVTRQVKVHILACELKVCQTAACISAPRGAARPTHLGLLAHIGDARTHMHTHTQRHTHTHTLSRSKQ